jgi:hypothetical protein
MTLIKDTEEPVETITRTTKAGISLEEAEAPVQKDVVEKLWRKFNTINKNQLPPEPIPGQYYRTIGGNKVLYIGKDKHDYFVYQVEDGDFIQYETATKFAVDGYTNTVDIIAPWTEPLPAVPIRRWALVSTVTRKEPPRASRGEVMRYCDSIEEAEEERGDEEEIVELVGTLPSSDAGK